MACAKLSPNLHLPILIFNGWRKAPRSSEAQGAHNAAQSFSPFPRLRGARAHAGRKNWLRQPSRTLGRPVGGGACIAALQYGLFRSWATSRFVHDPSHLVYGHPASVDFERHVIARRNIQCIHDLGRKGDAALAVDKAWFRLLARGLRHRRGEDPPRLMCCSGESPFWRSTVGCRRRSGSVASQTIAVEMGNPHEHKMSAADAVADQEPDIQLGPAKPEKTHYAIWSCGIFIVTTPETFRHHVADLSSRLGTPLATGVRPQHPPGVANHDWAAPSRGSITLGR